MDLFSRVWAVGRDAAVQSHRAGRPVLPLAALVFAACGGNDGVTIRGNVAGLDTLSLRGDSLVAEATGGAVAVDSIRRASQEALRRQIGESLAVIDPTTRRPASAGGTGTQNVSGADAPGNRAAGTVEVATTTGASASPSAGGVLSRRAQARGDSMAKAFAARLAGSGAARRASDDSVRGVLVWQGTEPTRMVVLRAADGTFALSGLATTGLGRLVGAEVVVRGVRVSPRDVVVAEYFVRAANGVPAFDGIILENGALRLSDGSGVKRVPLPASIKGLTGARVWVAPKAGKPQAFGLIQTR